MPTGNNDLWPNDCKTIRSLEFFCDMSFDNNCSSLVKGHLAWSKLACWLEISSNPQDSFCSVLVIFSSISLDPWHWASLSCLWFGLPTSSLTRFCSGVFFLWTIFLVNFAIQFLSPRSHCDAFCNRYLQSRTAPDWCHAQKTTFCRTCRNALRIV